MFDRIEVNPKSLGHDVILAAHIGLSQAEDEQILDSHK